MACSGAAETDFAWFLSVLGGGPLTPTVIPIHDETKPESHIGWTDEKGPNQGVAK